MSTHQPTVIQRVCGYERIVQHDQRPIGEDGNANCFPNILYIDNTSTAVNVLTIAMQVNALAYLPRCSVQSTALRSKSFVGKKE